MIHDRADHARIVRAIGCFEDQSVHAVLRMQSIVHTSVSLQHAYTADAPLRHVIIMLTQQFIKVGGLVSSMKVSHSEMHDHIAWLGFR